MRMENRMACVFAILIVITFRESLTAEPNNAWQYQCEVKQNVTDVLWILKFNGQTEMLSRCYVETQRCDQMLDDCTIATINSTSSLLSISANLEQQRGGQVGYAELINGMGGAIRFDAKRNPINLECRPSTETSGMFPSNQQTSALTDSPIENDPLGAWQYECEINENVTDVLWILRLENDTEKLSRCYVGSHSCDQNLYDCAIAPINNTSSLLNISASFLRQKGGRVGYAEIINGLRGEIRYDAKRNPINWACGLLPETTGMLPSNQQTRASTDSPTEKTSPPKGLVSTSSQSTQSESQGYVSTEIIGEETSSSGANLTTASTTTVSPVTDSTKTLVREVSHIIKISEISPQTSTSGSTMSSLPVSPEKFLTSKDVNTDIHEVLTPTTMTLTQKKDDQSFRDLLVAALAVTCITLVVICLAAAIFIVYYKTQKRTTKGGVGNGFM